MSIVFAIPHSLTTISTTQVVPKGTVFYGTGGRRYVFVYNFGADTFAAGDAITMSTTPVHGNVSSAAATIADVTDGSTIRPVLAGIALSAIATTQYGWLWFRGRGTHTITTDGNVVALDLLTIADGAKTLVREVTAAAVTHGIVGRAWATDSGTALTDTELGGQGVYNWG